MLIPDILQSLVTSLRVVPRRRSKTQRSKSPAVTAMRMDIVSVTAKSLVKSVELARIVVRQATRWQTAPNLAPLKELNAENATIPDTLPR